MLEAKQRFREFNEEVSDLGRQIDGNLLKWERSSDSAAVAEVLLQQLHSLKGTLGFMEHFRLAALLHAAEEVVDEFARTGKKPPKSVLDRLATAIGLVQQTLVSLNDEPVKEIQRVEQELQEERQKFSLSSSDEPLDSQKRPTPDGRLHYTLDLPNVPDLGADPIASTFGTGSARRLGLLEPFNSIRMEAAVLDTMMGLLSDTFIEIHCHSMILQDLQRRLPEQDVVALQHSHHRLERLVDGLHQAIVATRLSPLERVFGLFPRLVRQMSARLGKEVRLEIRGDDIKLDRLLLDRLFDPLVHLIRNALDHGIEAPSERIQRGKPAEGMIAISAASRGHNVVLDVVDDGRGIRAEKVAERAVELGLLASDYVNQLTDNDRLDLIFLNGFTSRREVSEVSGRGVGLAAVREQLQAIGGHIAVHSTDGCGTQIQVTFPLTLAVLDVLEVEAGKHRYAIPTSSVIGIHQVNRSHLVFSRGAWYLKRLPLQLRLASLQGLLGEKVPNLPSEPCLVIEVASGEKRMGLWVESWIGTHEVVMRRSPDSPQALKAIVAGTCIGAGQVIVVLDIAHLMADM